VFVTFEPTTAVSGALLIMRPERSGWRCLGFHVHHWAQQFWQDLHASSAGGGYVNMMMEDDEETGTRGVPGQLRPTGLHEATLRVRGLADELVATWRYASTPMALIDAEFTVDADAAASVAPLAQGVSGALVVFKERPPTEVLTCWREREAHPRRSVRSTCC
jgi:hypothetical protein